MTTLDAAEARIHFSRLLGQVVQGQEFTITRHGVAVAMLVPVPQRGKEHVHRAIEALLAFRKKNKLKLGGLSVRDLIAEGRP